MKKLSKVILSLLLAITLLCTNSGVCYASTDIPSGSNCINLSASGAVLGFQVEKLTYGNLFTNSTFTGVTAIEVNVGSISIDTNASAHPSNDIHVHLHKKSANIDVSTTVSISGGTIRFYNLDKNAKYYLQFSKTNDGQIYSFSGSIVED